MAYGDGFRALTDDEFRDELGWVCEKMIDMLSAKRKSYGPDNLTRFGDFGILVRLADKVERLRFMYNNGMTDTPIGEGLDDAWKDILGYAMLRMLVERTEHPNEKRDRPSLKAVKSEVDDLYAEIQKLRKRVWAEDRTDYYVISVEDAVKAEIDTSLLRRFRFDGFYDILLPKPTEVAYGPKPVKDPFDARIIEGDGSWTSSKP